MTDEGREPTLVRLGLALVATCTAATILYALLRAAQALLFREPDPALVIWSEHAGFFWRALTAGYGGGMVGFVAFQRAERHAAAVATALARAVLVAATLLAAQAMLIP